MDRMWQRVSNMRESLFSFPDPPLRPLSSISPPVMRRLHTGRNVEVLWGRGGVMSHRWGGGGGGGGVRKGGEGGGKEGESIDTWLHITVFLPSSQTCWASASCQCAGQAVPHCRQVQTSACNRLGETAARDMQGLVPLLPCRSRISLGCQIKSSSSFFSCTELLVPPAFIFSVAGR